MDTHRYWNRQGRRVARHYNFGWWLSAFLRLSAGVCVVFACALLVLRQAAAGTDALWMAFGGALVLAAIAAYGWARRKFFTARDGLVRLDVHLGLHSRLAAAAAGVGEFPPVRAIDAGWAWRWSRLLAPIAACGLFVAAAAWIPVGREEPPRATMEPPSAWTQVASWVEQLAESGIVEPQAIEELRAKLESLRDRPEAEWYAQSSLEAGDSLREQTAAAIRALQRDLENSAVALEAARQADGRMSPAELKAARQSMDQALQGLELGRLPLDAKTLADLKKIDLSQIKSLTPEQLAKMQQRLKEGAQACRSTTAGMAGDGLMLAFLAGESSGAGVQRGPGSKPLDLNPRATELKTSATAALPGADMERALPGEVVGLASGEHEVDREDFRGPVAAGSASATGEGGEAVWRDSLTPAEREMLKRFFK